MQLNILRAHLRGVSAYRFVMETDVMKRVCSMLDGICMGDGEKALEAYARAE